MREILRTSSISLAESLRLALDAQDIPAVVSNENLSGLPPAAISVAIAEDADYGRSLQILKDLDQTTPKSSRGSRRLLWFLLIVLFGAFVTLCVNLTWP